MAFNSNKKPNKLRPARTTGANSPQYGRKTKPAYDEQEPEDVFEMQEEGTYAWRNSGRPAIMDNGQEIQVKSDKPIAARMAVRMAQKKGWECIDISSGSDEFRSACWLECQRLGIQSQGYEPTLADTKKLERVVKETEEKLVTNKAILEKAQSYSPEKQMHDPHPDNNVLREVKKADMAPAPDSAKPSNPLDKLDAKANANEPKPELKPSYGFKYNTK